MLLAFWDIHININDQKIGFTHRGPDHLSTFNFVHIFRSQHFTQRLKRF